jgi:hypothetical protein
MRDHKGKHSKPTDNLEMSGAYAHFARRARERLGAGFNPKSLYMGIIWAIENERSDLVRFVSRVNRTGRRIFEFVPAGSGESFYVLVDTATMTPLTILSDEMEIGREGRSSFVGREQPEYA